MRPSSLSFGSALVVEKQGSRNARQILTFHCLQPRPWSGLRPVRTNTPPTSAVLHPLSLLWPPPSPPVAFPSFYGRLGRAGTIFAARNVRRTTPRRTLLYPSAGVSFGCWPPLPLPPPSPRRLCIIEGCLDGRVQVLCRLRLSPVASRRRQVWKSLVLDTSSPTSGAENLDDRHPPPLPPPPPRLSLILRGFFVRWMCADVF